MLGRGEPLPGQCRFAAGDVNGPAVRATYECARGRVDIELVHPGRAPTSATHTARFALVMRRGEPPPGLIDTLVARIRAREGAFEWKTLPDATPLEQGLLIAVIVVPAAALLLGCIVLGRALYRRRLAPMPQRPAVDAIRFAGLLGVSLLSLYGARNVLVVLGIASLSGFFWLALCGSFTFGSARRADWVGLVPFVVALGVRAGLTLHSLQDFDSGFAQGPIGRHSIVYPLLQMFFGPLVADPQTFTMRMNGVLGAFACLALYLFVRQRVESRAAGFLCALFFAVHPLIARFAPTDGPYSLLFATWFSGLALLSAEPLMPRALLGGAIFLGIAATTRMEGLVYLVASLLMLDPSALAAAVRRNKMLAAFSVLLIASLGAVQMYFLLPDQAGNGPTGGIVRPESFLSGVVWPTSYNHPLFTILVVIGAAAGVLRRSRLGLLAYVAMLVVVTTVANSTYSADALHRLAPACALQCVVAGMGAYALMGWAARRRHEWVVVVPGTAVACFVLLQRQGDLTRPYVFTAEYDMVHAHLARAAGQDCTLMTLNENAGCDVDIHDFRAVVPNVRVVDCRRTDCLAEVAKGGCLYYVRSSAAYVHEGDVPIQCAASREEPVACMNEVAAAFEKSVELQPIEVRTIDLGDTFRERRMHFPAEAQLGLFRVSQARAGL